METWRPVAGYPGYEISDMGNLRSWLKLARSAGAPSEPRLLKGGVDREGYRRAVLCGPGGRKSIKIHHLVLMAFGRVRPSPKHVTRHLDGNPQNNTIGNLAWGTQAENVADRDAGPRAVKKLSDSDVEKIRALRGKVSGANLARTFGVHPSTVCDIQKGRTRSFG